MNSFKNWYKSNLNGGISNISEFKNKYIELHNKLLKFNLRIDQDDLIKRSYLKILSKKTKVFGYEKL